MLYFENLNPVLLAFALPVSLFAQGEERSSELHAPLQVLAADKPINVGSGHAAPFLADMDGDGLKDLLVGQFGDKNTEGEGALRIYKNVGKKGQPRFTDFQYFRAGGEVAKVPRY